MGLDDESPLIPGPLSVSGASGEGRQSAQHTPSPHKNSTGPEPSYESMADPPPLAPHTGPSTGQDGEGGGSAWGSAPADSTSQDPEVEHHDAQQEQEHKPQLCSRCLGLPHEGGCWEGDEEEEEEEDEEALRCVLCQDCVGLRPAHPSSLPLPLSHHHLLCAWGLPPGEGEVDEGGALGGLLLLPCCFPVLTGLLRSSASDEEGEDLLLPLHPHCLQEWLLQHDHCPLCASPVPWAAALTRVRHYRGQRDTVLAQLLTLLRLLTPQTQMRMGRAGACEAVVGLLSDYSLYCYSPEPSSPGPSQWPLQHVQLYDTNAPVLRRALLLLVGLCLRCKPLQHRFLRSPQLAPLLVRLLLLLHQRSQQQHCPPLPMHEQDGLLEALLAAVGALCGMGSNRRGQMALQTARLLPALLGTLRWRLESEAMELAAAGTQAPHRQLPHSLLCAALRALTCLLKGGGGGSSREEAAQEAVGAGLWQVCAGVLRVLNLRQPPLPSPSPSSSRNRASSSTAPTAPAPRPCAQDESLLRHLYALLCVLPSPWRLLLNDPRPAPPSDTAPPPQPTHVLLASGLADELCVHLRPRLLCGSEWGGRGSALMTPHTFSALVLVGKLAMACPLLAQRLRASGLCRDLGSAINTLLLTLLGGADVETLALCSLFMTLCGAPELQAGLGEEGQLCERLAGRLMVATLTSKALSLLLPTLLPLVASLSIGCPQNQRRLRDARAFDVMIALLQGEEGGVGLELLLSAAMCLLGLCSPSTHPHATHDWEEHALYVLEKGGGQAVLSSLTRLSQHPLPSSQASGSAASLAKTLMELGAALAKVRGVSGWSRGLLDGPSTMAAILATRRLWAPAPHPDSPSPPSAALGQAALRLVYECARSEEGEEGRRALVKAGALDVVFVTLGLMDRAHQHVLMQQQHQQHQLDLLHQQQQLLHQQQRLLQQLQHTHPTLTQPLPPQQQDTPQPPPPAAAPVPALSCEASAVPPPSLLSMVPQPPPSLQPPPLSPLDMSLPYHALLQLLSWPSLAPPPVPPKPSKPLPTPSPEDVDEGARLRVAHEQLKARMVVAIASRLKAPSCPSSPDYDPDSLRAALVLAQWGARQDVDLARRLGSAGLLLRCLDVMKVLQTQAMTQGPEGEAATLLRLVLDTLILVLHVLPPSQRSQALCPSSCPGLCPLLLELVTWQGSAGDGRLLASVLALLCYLLHAHRSHQEATWQHPPLRALLHTALALPLPKAPAPAAPPPPPALPSAWGLSACPLLVVHSAATLVEALAAPTPQDPIDDSNDPPEASASATTGVWAELLAVGGLQGLASTYSSYASRPCPPPSPSQWASSLELPALHRDLLRTLHLLLHLAITAQPPMLGPQDHDWMRALVTSVGTEPYAAQHVEVRQEARRLLTLLHKTLGLPPPPPSDPPTPMDTPLEAAPLPPTPQA